MKTKFFGFTGCVLGACLSACGSNVGSDYQGDEPLATSESALTLQRVPGLVMGLLHNQNQTPDNKLMYSALPGEATYREGGDRGAPNHRGYEWWQIWDSPTQDPTPYTSLLPPGVVVGLKHSQNQAAYTITAFGRNAVNGPASFPGFVRQSGGDLGASSGVGYYWYELTGSAFTNWSQIDSILPKYTVVGLKHSSNQASKVLTWNGVVYNPVNTSPVPPGFRRRVGGDQGAPNGVGYYWYEKITGSEIVKLPTMRQTLPRNLFLGYGDPGSLDKDGDCLADAQEGQLATLFRPAVYFNSTEHALESGEPVTVFRVYPTSAWSVHVRLVVLFRNDGGYDSDDYCDGGDGHAGDNDNIDYDLTTYDGGRTWTLSNLELSFEGLNWPDDSRLETYSAQNPIIYLSGSKHHEYFTRDIDGNDSIYSDPYIPYTPIPLEDCNDSVNGLGPRILPNLSSLKPGLWNNVGEPNLHPTCMFVNALDAYYPGKTIWGGEAFYGVGANRDKFPQVPLPACASNNCAHSVCTVGAALSTSCFADAATICAFDSYCCDVEWDVICVGEVPSGCN